MADSEHLEILAQGVEIWNRWRADDPDNSANPNLIEADLIRRNLSGVNFSGASLQFAYLNDTNLTKANLSGADLRGAHLLKTDLSDATLTDCAIWGIAAWGIKLDGATQKNLKIAHESDSVIILDDIEVAQFIYMLVNNKKIRNVIDTISSKVVLILGRFTSERKTVLDALRDELRRRNYTPVLFDFEGPSSRDLTETISTLAHLSKFIIADITDAKSILQELMAIVPSLPSVPVKPLLLDTQKEYVMFEHLRRYPWVLPVQYYKNTEDLIACLEERVIGPAEEYMSRAMYF